MKKITKGVKKAAKATYNFVIGDDIKTLKSKKTKWYQKPIATVSIGSNFIPGGGVLAKAAKAVVKGTAKAIKAIKATKAVTKAIKVVKATAKKVSSFVNIKPKTVPAPSIKSAPPIQSSAPAKVSVSTPKAKPKVVSSNQPARGAVVTRGEKNYSKNSFMSDNSGPSSGNVAKGTGEGLELYRRTANVGEFSHLEVPMQLRDVKRLAKQAGIGLDGVKVKIIRDPEMIRLPHAGWANPNGKEIQLYPNAFINEEQLVKTLAHERTHIFQVRLYGEAKDIPMLDKFEEGAYGIENTFWDYFNRKGR